MNRADLEHLIRAAAAVTNEYEFVIVGSQSILGPIPYPPDELKMSAEGKRSGISSIKTFQNLPPSRLRNQRGIRDANGSSSDAALHGGGG